MDERATEIKQLTMIKDLSRYKIIELQAEVNNSYARSDGDIHWIWGDNAFGQCTLQSRKKPSKRDKKLSPYRIDQIFHEKTNRKIKRVYLGNARGFVIPFV